MRTLSLIVALSLTSAASAESFNIDFISAFGVPSDTYGAAAGQPGMWNLLTVIGAPTPLFDLGGDPTGVTLSASGSPVAVIFDNPGTSGDDQALMDDLFDIGGVGSTLTLTLSGLTDGSYDVYTYAWAPDSGDFRTGVNVNGTGEQDVGGAWPGGHAVGTTHALHSVDVVGGTIMIDLVTTSGFGSLNGLQIVMIPAPAALGMFGLAGILGSRRRRR